MKATMTTTPNIKQAQFISLRHSQHVRSRILLGLRLGYGGTYAAVGFGTLGKKRKMASTVSQHNAPMLMNIPALPRLNREGGSGSPRKRFPSMVEIAMMYVTIKATLQIERMTLKLNNRSQ